MYRQNRRNNPDFNTGGNYMGNPDSNTGGNYMGNPDFNAGGNYKGNPDFNAENNYKGNPDFNPGNNYKSNPDFNPGNNYKGNPDFNPGSNYKGNPDFNPSSNYKGNPDFNTGGNYMGNPDFNPGGNYMGNPDFNPGNNYKSNPDFNTGGNYKGNPDFNPGNNYKSNPDFNPSSNYKGNPDFNIGGNYMGNPDFNPGGNYMGNPDFNPGNNYKGNPDGGMNLNFGGNDSRRTVTVQSEMNYDCKPMFDRAYNNNDSQPNSNLSEAQNRHYNPVVMNYEQTRNQYNDERTLSFKPNRDVEMNRSGNNRSEPSSQVYSIIQKMKMYLNDKPIRNPARLFVDAANFASASFELNYIPSDSNTRQYRFNVLVENVFLAFGTSLRSNESSSSAKKTAQHAAYLNALNRLKNSSAEEICSGSVGKPAAKVNAFAYDPIIEPDPMRPLSALVIKETKKSSVQRVKNAMRILRSSVFFSKMILDTATSEVGNMHKVTVFVQKKPVGIGLGSTMTIATINAAGDALFNNFYRKCPIISMSEEDNSKKWINWAVVEYLANEVESIGGRTLGFGQGISNRSFAIAITKLINSHSWNEVDDELVFGPGMSDDCARSLSNIAKERNLKLRVRKHRLGNYYILQRYYDPLDLVDYLKRNGGRQGKCRLADKSEIPQIQCDYWEPSFSVWNDDKVPKSKAFNLPHSKDKYSMSDNDGRFNQKFTQDKEMGGFNDREFRQVSRSNSDFRPRSDSFDREPTKVSWADDRGFRQMSQPNDKEYGQSRWLDNNGIRQMHRSDDLEFGQMSRPDDREFRSVSRTNIKESNQTTWRDRMPGSYDRETSRSDTKEFRAMDSLERELRLRGQMERGMSDNKEFNFDKNPRLGHDERRQDYTGQNFNRMSNDQDREFNPQFRTNDGDRRQMQRTYDDNLDELTRERDNRNYNQMGPNRRNYDDVSSVDNNKFYSQGPNYDDRRLRFNDEPQLSSLDRPNNPMNPNNMMDTNRMPNNGPWNNMQNSRNDDRRMANNSGMFPPNNPMPPQGNMIMQQNVMALRRDLNKNQINALQFLTKKIAHTALHANVKNILANARRLSNIASARSRMETSGSQMPPFRAKIRGKGVGNHPLSVSKQKAALMLQYAQKKKTNEKQSNSKKSSNQKVSSQNKK